MQLIRPLEPPPPAANRGTSYQRGSEERFGVQCPRTHAIHSTSVHIRAAGARTWIVEARKQWTTRSTQISNSWVDLLGLLKNFIKFWTFEIISASKNSADWKSFTLTSLPDIFKIPCLRSHVTSLNTILPAMIFIYLFWSAPFSPPYDILELLAWAFFLFSCTRTSYTQKPHSPSDSADTHSLRGLLPRAPTCFKRRSLLSTVRVCAPSAAAVNFKRPACVPASSMAEMVLGDRVSGLTALCHMEIIQTSRRANDFFCICCGG